MCICPFVNLDTVLHKREAQGDFRIQCTKRRIPKTDFVSGDLTSSPFLGLLSPQGRTNVIDPWDGRVGCTTYDDPSSLLCK